MRQSVNDTDGIGRLSKAPRLKPFRKADGGCVQAGKVAVGRDCNQFKRPRKQFRGLFSVVKRRSPILVAGQVMR